MKKDFISKFYAISSLLSGIAGDYALEFLMLDNEKMREVETVEKIKTYFYIFSNKIIVFYAIIHRKRRDAYVKYTN